MGKWRLISDEPFAIADFAPKDHAIVTEKLTEQQWREMTESGELNDMPHFETQADLDEWLNEWND